MYDEYGEPSETLVTHWNEHNDHADGAGDPPEDQAWFWTEDWQAGEAEATAQISAGGLPVYDDMATLLAEIDHAPDTTVARVRAFLDTCDNDGIDDTTPILDVVGYDLTPGDLRALLAGAPTSPSRQPEAYDLFAHVADITAWLDACNPDGPHEDSMRVLKLTEEAGEAAAAYLGMVGQNPRKGFTHTLSDLLGELADVALTALCAIQHFTRDEAATRATLAAKTHRIIARSDIPRARP